MYEAYFGFQRKPFLVTPDPSFFFPSQAHREGLARLRYVVQEGLGFAVLTGEVGTGKTHLIRSILSELGESCQRAYLINPLLEPVELVAAVLRDLGETVTNGLSYAELVEQFNQYLLEVNRLGQKVVVIVDESQNLSVPALESLRLLSNLETASQKLVQIILVGQPELKDLLDQEALRQVKQRVVVWYHLSPFNAAETADYITYRTRAASRNLAEVEWTRGATQLIYQFSRGIPRKISILSDYALVAAYTAETRRITTDVVEAGLDLYMPKRIRTQPAARPWLRNWWPAPVSGAAVLVVLLLLASVYDFQPNHLWSWAREQPIGEVLLLESNPQDAGEQPGQSEQIEADSYKETGLSSPKEDHLAQPTDRNLLAEPLAEPVVETSPQPEVLDQSETAVLLEVQESAVAPETPDNGFGVQVASLRTSQRAERMARQAQPYGSVWVVPWVSPAGDVWYRVVVGRGLTRSDADLVARQVKKNNLAADARVTVTDWETTPPDANGIRWLKSEQ